MQKFLIFIVIAALFLLGGVGLGWWFRTVNYQRTDIEAVRSWDRYGVVRSIDETQKFFVLESFPYYPTQRTTSRTRVYFDEKTVVYPMTVFTEVGVTTRIPPPQAGNVSLLKPGSHLHIFGPSPLFNDGIYYANVINVVSEVKAQ